MHVMGFRLSLNRPSSAGPGLSVVGENGCCGAGPKTHRFGGFLDYPRRRPSVTPGAAVGSRALRHRGRGWEGTA